MDDFTWLISRSALARGPKPWGSFASGSGSDKVDGAANSLPLEDGTLRLILGVAWGVAPDVGCETAGGAAADRAAFDSCHADSLPETRTGGTV